MKHDIPVGDLRFSDLGLSPNVLAALNRLQFTIPTPIQAKSIPVAAEGKDVIGIAQTGTGKTLAFAAPMLQEILRTKKRGLVVLPTRELAMQVDELLGKLASSFKLKRALLIGGASMYNQINQLRQNPDIIICTPGRMIDHLENKKVKLDNVGVLVLDEADRMLDMGFAPQIKRLLQGMPKERQTMLFSATMPVEIVKIAATHMKMPVRIEVARAGTVAERVDQELFVVKNDQKARLLDKLLHEYKGTVLVFSRTKYGAKKICRAVRGMGHTAAEIHSNLSLSQRRHSLEGFKSGKYRILVATDIAARGIDVTNIELVINYDLPDNPDDYVHRVGRTGRAGKVGRAISFIMPDQRGKVRMIERLVRSSLSVSPLPDLPAHRPQLAYGKDDSRRNYSRGNSRNKFSQGRGRSPRQGGNRFRDNKPSGNRNNRKRARVHF